MSNVEELILFYLSKGYTQHEISKKLKAKKVSPSSVSAVEKICFALRQKYKAKTSFQLAVKLCKKGIL